MEYFDNHPWSKPLLVLALGFLVMGIAKIISGGLSLPKISLPNVQLNLQRWLQRDPKPTTAKKAKTTDWPWWKSWGAGIITLVAFLTMTGFIFPAFLPAMWEKLTLTVMSHWVGSAALLALVVFCSFFGRGVSWTVRIMAAIAFIGLMYHSDGPQVPYLRSTVNEIKMVFSTNEQLKAAGKPKGENQIVHQQIIIAPASGSWSELTDTQTGGRDLTQKDNGLRVAFTNLGTLKNGSRVGGPYIMGEEGPTLIRHPNGSIEKISPGEFIKSSLREGVQFQSGTDEQCLIVVTWFKP